MKDCVGIDVRFRSAAPDDVPVILALIRELAEYEKLAHAVTATEERLRESLFGRRRHAEVLLAEEDGRPVGFCLFFHNYSTFLAKPGLYIEDLYVRPEYRGGGIGRRFFSEIGRIARERGCGRIEWWVLNWNAPAIGFYERMGAQAMDQWVVYRLAEKQFEQI